MSAPSQRWGDRAALYADPGPHGPIFGAKINTVPSAGPCESPMRPRLAILLILFLALMAASNRNGSLAEDSVRAAFTVPDALAPAVRFWTRVYTEVDSASGFIHDSRNLDVVYGILYLNPAAPPRAQNTVIERVLGEYRRALLALWSGGRDAGTSIEKRARRAWGQEAGAAELKEAAERLRFQRGQSDRILGGLNGYTRWKGKIQAILRGQGLPVELAALPLVESSYNPRAVSKAGARGLWQFMPATARRYLRVDQGIDERLDPVKSSEAAAQLLQQNYSVLKSWPLAITAYNHGLSGVRRAVRETGTEDLGEIAKRYETERFGFASRNFYAAFLAAVEVSSHPGRYFRDYQQDPPDPIALVNPAYLPVDVLVAGLGIDKDWLRSLNPLLHHEVWNGRQFVPGGYVLQLPATFERTWAEERLARLAAHFGFSSQRPSPYYEARLGDSLSEIAQRHGTTAQTLLALNHLKSMDEIHAGQKLRVPRMLDPDPLGAGSAALLEAQRLSGDIDVDSVDLPRLIAALVGQDGRTNQEGSLPSDPERPEPDIIPASDSDASVAVWDLAAGVDAQQSESLAEVQPDLAADPLDYGVAPDGTIEIQIGETLGHYADWLHVSSERIRRLNGLRKGTPLIVGRRLKLDLSAASAPAFEKRRLAHHEARQLEYFSHHRIRGVIEHPVSAGDNLWLLAVEQYRIPLWLLRQYNPDINVDSILSLGSVILVPMIESSPDRSASGSGLSSDSGRFSAASRPGTGEPRQQCRQLLFQEPGVG